MKQLTLLAAGCQKWNRQVIATSSGVITASPTTSPTTSPTSAAPLRVCYASTLGVYVHLVNSTAADLSDPPLERLVAAHERTISSLVWSPVSATQFITASADGYIRRFDMASSSGNEDNGGDGKDASISQVTVPGNGAVIGIDWCSSSPHLLSVLYRSSATTSTISLWDGTSATLDSVPKLSAAPLATCVRWSPSITGTSTRLAVGHADGSVWIWDRSADSLIKLAADPARGGAGVLDLQWDPLGSDCIVAILSGGHMLLIDTTKDGSLRNEFTRQKNDHETVAWLRWAPGTFVTANQISNILYVWNVSQREPIQTIKVGTSKRSIGITSVRVVGTTSISGQRLLISYNDGGVSLFDYVSRRVVSISQSGHSETIFDCRFKPSTPNILATASYDGSVKLWDAVNFRCVNELRGVECVLYSLSWAPGGDDEHRLVTSSSNGQCTIWDTKKGQELVRIAAHSTSSLRVAWSPNGRLIASTSTDGLLVIFTPSGEIVRKYTHDDAVYGVDWHPTKHNILLVGCGDGSVYVYDTDPTSSPKPLAHITGHTSRVFNVAWSPLLPDTFASGSDDRTIRIGSLASSEVKVLRGHTGNVRALLWSTEVPYLLMTGSWDGSIRSWDIRSEKCIASCNDHHADVYGLSSHPSRPFTIASSSRDTSLRLWSLDDFQYNRLRLRTLIDGATLQPSLFADIKDAMKVNTPLRLCGRSSNELAIRLRSAECKTNDCLRFSLIQDFFGLLPGQVELFQLIESLIATANGNAGSTDGSNGVTSIIDSSVVHINDLRRASMSRARSLQTQRDGVIQSSTRQSRLLAAAELYLRNGNIHDYCEILISLGRWERAIAIAPSHSMIYWQSISERYATYMASLYNDEDALPFYVAAGNADKLCSWQLSRGDVKGALLTSVNDATGLLPRFPVNVTETKTDNANAEQKEEKRQSVPPTELVRSAIDRMADDYSRSAQPILAACCYLAISDPMRAVDRLVNGDELPLAFALCRILKLSLCDHVYRSLSSLYEDHGMWDEAATSLQLLREPRDELTLLAARFGGTADKKSEFYLRCGIRSSEAFASAVDASLKDGRVSEAIIFAVAAGDSLRAVDIGLPILRDVLSRSSWGIDEVTPILAPLHSVNAIALPAAARNELLVYSYYIAAQQAIWKGAGHSVIVPFLLEGVRNIINRNSISFPINNALLKMMEASYFSTIDPRYALTVITSAISDTQANASATKLKTSVTSLISSIQKLVDRSNATPSVSSLSSLSSSTTSINNSVIPYGSLLPSLSSRSRVSMISKRTITGTRVIIEDGTSNISYISRAEAVIWQRLTPFSPAANGNRLRLLCM